MGKPTKTTPHVPNKSPVIKPSGLSRGEKIEAIKLITRKLVIRDSGLAGLMLWIPMGLGRDDLNAYAYTDGTHIYYCDSFFGLPPAQQLAVVIHETLHVVLRHAYRFKQIHNGNMEKFNPQVANLCADAIVIRAIKQCPKIGPLEITNPYIITAEDIVTPEDLKKIPAQQWNFEMLYHYMLKKVDAAVEKFKSKFGQEPNDDLQGGDLQGGEEKPSDPHMEKMENQIWKERFKRAAAGSEPGSILREVSKDLPDTNTPWQKHFREFMIAHIMPTTTLDWSRPSRRLLASKGKLGYYEPGIQRELGVKTAGIVIDTSGSIDPELLSKFIAETNAIMEQTGCNVVLICADAAVQSIDHFNEPIKKNYQAKGGGGTDFRPAIEELEKHDIDCCVYLTDMCGTFPEHKPSYPVLWASLTEMTPPFGRLIVVDYLNA
jgi:predicted metal-dependent peptidase